MLYMDKLHKTQFNVLCVCRSCVRPWPAGKRCQGDGRLPPPPPLPAAACAPEGREGREGRGGREGREGREGRGGGEGGEGGRGGREGRGGEGRETNALSPQHCLVQQSFFAHIITGYNVRH